MQRDFEIIIIIHKFVMRRDACKIKKKFHLVFPADFVTKHGMGQCNAYLSDPSHVLWIFIYAAAGWLFLS